MLNKTFLPTEHTDSTVGIEAYRKKRGIRVFNEIQKDID